MFFLFRFHCTIVIGNKFLVAVIVLTITGDNQGKFCLYGIFSMSKLVIFLVKNQHALRKSLYLVKKPNEVLTKIGHNIKVLQKMKLSKNYKKCSPELELKKKVDQHIKLSFKSWDCEQSLLETSKFLNCSLYLANGIRHVRLANC